MRQIVGYDRFEGLAAYKQLRELYRAVRLYVNFFQPLMKLKMKYRINSKLKKVLLSGTNPFSKAEICSMS